MMGEILAVIDEMDVKRDVKKHKKEIGYEPV